jgi:phage terminase large subunit
MKIQFKTKIRKQIQAIRYWVDNETEEILYGGAKGGGKSYLGASLIFGDALIYPETQFYIARKELIDLRKFTVPTIHEVFRNWGLQFEDYAVFNGQDNVFNLKNGSKVFLVACNDVPSDPLYERFGSMQMTRGWLEEAGEIPEAAKANLWLATGRWKNDIYNLKKKQLITANPKKGWMKREFVTPYQVGQLPSTKKYIQAFATDNSYLPEDYVKTLREEKDPVRRQRLYEGSWDYDEDQDSLVTYDALSDCFSNTIIKDGQKYLVVDVARFGKDTTTINQWDGLELNKIDVFSKQDTQNTIQKVKDNTKINQIPWSNTMIDEDGIGGAVVDGMLGVKGFIANSSPIPTRTNIVAKQGLRYINDFIPKTNFRNLKTQCAFKLADLINEHKIKFSVPEYREIIIEELSALLRHKNADGDGKLQIKPKDEVKESIGRSPDIGDAIIMRMWYELKKDALAENPPEQEAINQRKEAIFSRNKNNLKSYSNR